MITPLRFVPYLRPLPWGGRRLVDTLHKSAPQGQLIGESWELSDHPLHDSIVAEGSWQGRSLRNLMENERELILGPAAAIRFERFPWLVKFLDANDWLSVQVHPKDEQAARLRPGEKGKTEAWFVLRAEPKSRIYAGLKKCIGVKELRAALANDSVAECLHSFTPAPGDCVFLPAGTVHAVGGGVLFAEVQQNSDATFRLFDWNRRDAAGKSRELHIEEALACIDWTCTAVAPQHVPEYAEPSRNDREVTRRLVDCPYFRLEYRQHCQPFEIGTEGRMQVMQVLAGAGSIGTAQLEVGQTWLLPAALQRQQCVVGPMIALLVASLV